MSGRVQRAVESVGHWHAIRHWRQARFDKAFFANRAIGCHRGVFRTFEEAAASAPTSLPLGFDHASAGQMYRDRLDTLYDSDYPMMVWLGTSSCFTAAAPP